LKRMKMLFLSVCFSPRANIFDFLFFVRFPKIYTQAEKEKISFCVVTTASI
jgi:hypothetical protein